MVSFPFSFLTPEQVPQWADEKKNIVITIPFHLPITVSPLVRPHWSLGEQPPGSKARVLNNTSKLSSSCTFVITFLCHQIGILFSWPFHISVIAILGCQVGAEERALRHGEGILGKNCCRPAGKQRAAVKIAGGKQDAHYPLTQK